MKKNYIIFYLCLFFIFIIYIYPIQYKSNIINLVNLFFYFFLPALLPTSFFLNILLKTNIIQNIKNKKVSSFLITFLLAFGGTPLFLVLSKYIDKTKFKGQEYRFVGPSFSFMIYLFQINHNQFSFLFSFLLIMPTIILNFIKPITFEFYKLPENQFKLKDFVSSIDEVIKSIYKLLMIIALIFLFKPLFENIFPPNIYNFICGIFEYTSASIQLVKSDEILPLIFILEFNGISSMLAIKNECPKLNIRTFIIKRAFLSGIIMLLFSFLLKSLNY
ncbi:unknown [Firmicutes bacterium CAG:345]|mgnify:FL=1|nr:unknown [Firmicutes bacterium CAG:345]